MQIAELLEAGPEPRPPDLADVRRRARRLGRRRVGLAAAALILPAAIAVSRLDEGTEPVETTGAQTELLFERTLPSGETLRVSRVGGGQLEVAITGLEPLRIDPFDGNVSGATTAAPYPLSDEGEAEVALGLGFAIGSGDQRWHVWSIASCSDVPVLVELGPRGGPVLDTMDPVDGVAVLAAPTDDTDAPYPPSLTMEGGLPNTAFGQLIGDLGGGLTWGGPVLDCGAGGGS